jgi:hypothetical protein
MQALPDRIETGGPMGVFGLEVHPERIAERDGVRCVT